jgi:hypothetical protein
VVFLVIGPAHAGVGDTQGGDAGLSPETVMNIPAKELAESLYVVRGRGLFMNLEKARTPADWLRVPGVKGAWKKKPGLRGKTVLQDADGDGTFELYGESGSGKPGCSSFWCREADGTERWQTDIRKSSGDNNGVQCDDLDGDGRYEAVSVGNYLTIVDAKDGRIKHERFIFADFHGSPTGDPRGNELRFDYPYRLGRCSNREQLDIVVANGYTPTGATNVQNYPQGGVQVICYKNDGESAWHYKHAGEGYWGGGHEIRVHDLDGDGLDEVIHSANGGVVCLNHDGAERWRHDIGMHSDWIAVADVTGDGRLDVVVQHGGATGHFYLLNADTGAIERQVKNEPRSEVQNFAVGRFRPQLPGRQLAITTLYRAELRMLDLYTGRYLEFPVGAADQQTIRKWNDLDMYNCAAHDADGDGEDEIFTFTTPKPYQLHRAGKEELPTDAAKALTVGVAAFQGNGELAQYWNFYQPIESGVQWGVLYWDMRQFQHPPRRFDVDGNGIEEAYLETEPWILLFEIADLR